MMSIGVLLRRNSNIYRSKDLTLVHIKGGGSTSRLSSNEGMVGGLVNRTRGPAGKEGRDTLYGTPGRSVEFYN
jgi:hypothetical protein